MSGALNCQQRGLLAFLRTAPSHLPSSWIGSVEQMTHLGECCEHGDGACVGAADGAVGVEQAQRQDARVQVRLPHTGKADKTISRLIWTSYEGHCYYEWPVAVIYLERRR